MYVELKLEEGTIIYEETTKMPERKFFELLLPKVTSCSLCSNDTTKRGHDLGNPNDRTTIPPPERVLSPLAVCIIRALMHSAFIWTCSNNESSLGDVVALMNSPVHPSGLPEFFWRHLEKDLEGICAVLRRGEDEAILLVHLVLRNILTCQHHARKHS